MTSYHCSTWIQTSELTWSVIHTAINTILGIYFGDERKEARHLPGDLSTHRPGNLKGLNSGFGAEEVEEWICIKYYPPL